jgi:Fe-S-cluster containining protein
MACEAVISAESILSASKRLQLDDCFTFRCDKDLDCFGRCCRDVTIVLTPYDVLRLKRARGMESTEFLEKYTLCPQVPDQKFPIVILKMSEGDKQCPFLDREGCGVYADRPWACRMYPLGAAEPKTPTPEEKPFHFVIHESLCHGHRESAHVSVREWMRAQGAEAFEMMSGGFKELTLHDFWNGDRTLTQQQGAMFYMACYDLDRFRRFVFETRFLQLFEIDEARVEALRADDEELLEFGMQWLRFSIFGERSMKIRKENR